VDICCGLSARKMFISSNCLAQIVLIPTSAVSGLIADSIALIALHGVCSCRCWMRSCRSAL
jgi:hypothetical protein